MALTKESSLRMPSGYDIPMLGFGVYQTYLQWLRYLCHANPPQSDRRSGRRHCSRRQARLQTCKSHHSFHIKHRLTFCDQVDSATAYRNEAEASKGLLAAGLPREQLFYTSKVPPKSINYADAKACVDESLSKTGLDYIDLYLLHCPYGGKAGRLGAWQALTEAVDAGKVRSIGVSNYGVHHLEELEQHIQEIDGKQGKGKGGVLSVNQVELHPWLARDDIVQWCQKKGIVMEAYSPLVRATRMDETILQTLSKKYGKTESQILLRWGLQKNFVILPKSVTHSRIEENSKLYDFELSDEDMSSLTTSEYAPCTWDPTTSHD